MSFPEKICRLCEGKLFRDPLTTLKNVSKSAQWLPMKSQIHLDKPIDLKVFQCSACGLVQLNRQPVDYYKEVITAASYSKKMLDFRAKQASEFVNEFGLLNKKVIEIGCGNGYYINLLTQAGAIAYGLEASNRTKEEILQNGPNIIVGYPSTELVIKNGPFDAFVSINFLEHSPNPNDFLRGIYNNLKPKSIGLVEVPSLEQIFEKKRFYDWIMDHLSYFSIDSLKFALEKNGFKVIDIKRVWGGDDILATVKKREEINLEIWEKEKAQLFRSLKSIVVNENKTGNSVAIWGASHQALTILSMSKISGIQYVIDSAPFKQEHYTPVTHIPIVKPEVLRSDPVDMVIVMAAGYTDEVVHQLKTKFMFNGTVAVLVENKIEIK